MEGNSLSHVDVDKEEDDHALFPQNDPNVVDKSNDTITTEKNIDNSESDPKENEIGPPKAISRIQRNHLISNIIGDVNSGITTRKKKKC